MDSMTAQRHISTISAIRKRRKISTINDLLKTRVLLLCTCLYSRRVPRPRLGSSVDLACIVAEMLLMPLLSA